MTPPIVQITDDYGGNVLSYVERVEEWRREGAVVEISGACSSACTLVLGLPSVKVCVWPGAIFGFHTASGAWGTANLLHAYPKKVKAWLDVRGGLQHEVKWTSEDDAQKLIAKCDDLKVN